MAERQKEGGQWSEQQVKEILHNPIYVGIGRAQALVDEQTWIGAQAINFERHGVRPTLRLMREVLHSHLGATPACMAGADWLDRSYLTIAQQGADVYFRALIASLRTELGKPIN